MASPSPEDRDCPLPSTSTSPTNSSTLTSVFSDDLFRRHRVTRFDTLAGLAVKYNVTVSDIKRANGFLSDTAMFARDTIIIPTRSLANNSEYAAWTGMIFAHLNRIPARRSVPPHHTSSVQRLRGYYSTGPSPLSYSPEDSDNEGDAGHDVLRALSNKSGRQSRPLPGEVELMARDSARVRVSSPDDRLRRRRANEDCDMDALQGSDQVLTFMPDDQGAASRPGQSPFDAPQLRELQRRSSNWRDALLSKLKRVASQPALAGAGPGGAATVPPPPEAVPLSVRSSGALGGASSMQHLQHTMYNGTNSRSKEGRKAD